MNDSVAEFMFRRRRHVDTARTLLVLARFAAEGVLGQNVVERDLDWRVVGKKSLQVNMESDTGMTVALLLRGLVARSFEPGAVRVTFAGVVDAGEPSASLN